RGEVLGDAVDHRRGLVVLLLLHVLRELVHAVVDRDLRPQRRRDRRDGGGQRESSEGVAEARCRHGRPRSFLGGGGSSPDFFGGAAAGAGALALQSASFALLHHLAQSSARSRFSPESVRSVRRIGVSICWKAVSTSGFGRSLARSARVFP